MNRLGMIGFAGLFSGTFWQGFRYQTPQAIEDELKKESPSLRILLNEEDIIQEVKNGSNQKLQDFLAKNLNELIEFITVMPMNDEHERGHKFPFVVSEILNCDCAPILDAFFQPPQEKVPQKEEDEKEEHLDEMPWLSSHKAKEDDDDQDEDDSAKHYENEEDDDGPLVVKNQKTEDAQPEDEDPKPAEPLPELTDQDVEADKPEGDKEDDEQPAQMKEAATEPADEAEEEQKEEKEEKEDNEEQVDKEPEQEEAEEGDNDTEKVEETTQALFEEEEEKMHAAMTQDSTTCETRERCRYESIDKLFQFVMPQRPTSSASSLASEATNVTTAQEEDAEELNPVLCGYFAKLVMHFVLKRPKEFFLYISERPRVLHNMASHIYSRAIADSLIRVLTCENHGLEDSSTFGDYNELRNSIIEEILSQINEHSAPWTMQNAANIIVDLSLRRPFFDVLATPAYLNLVFTSLFGKEDTDILKDSRKKLIHIRRHSMRILSTLISQYKANLIKDANKDEDKKDEDRKDGDKNKSPASFGDDDDVLIGDDEESPEKKSPKKVKQEEEDEEEVKNDQAEKEQKKEQDEEAPQEVKEPSPLVEALISKISKLIVLLDIDPPISTDTITGLEAQPLGGARLSIVEMLSDIVRLNEPELNAKLIETNVLKKLLQLFGKHEWNSLLHFKLDLIFSEILRNHDSNPQMLHALFEEGHFINYVTQLIRSEDFQLKNKTGRRIERGFFPYIIRFIDTIETLREKSTYIEEQLNKFGEEEWKDIWKERVTPKKTKYAKQLGGHNPNQKQSFKKDDDIVTANISNKFTSYQGGAKEAQKSGDDDDQPEEDIINKRDDDDDDDDDLPASRRTERHTEMLQGLDESTDSHSSDYIQKSAGEDKTFQAWNVPDPEAVLEKERKKGPGLTMEELSNEFDYPRGDEEDNFGDFDSQRATAGGFSADEFGEFQSGEEFFDAHGPSEEENEVGANEDVEYNDFNFWNIGIQPQDLSKLMNEM